MHLVSGAVLQSLLLLHGSALHVPTPVVLLQYCVDGQPLRPVPVAQPGTQRPGLPLQMIPEVALPH